MRARGDKTICRFEWAILRPCLLLTTLQHLNTKPACIAGFAASFESSATLLGARLTAASSKKTTCRRRFWYSCSCRWNRSTIRETEQGRRMLSLFVCSFSVGQTHVLDGFMVETKWSFRCLVCCVYLPTRARKQQDRAKKNAVGAVHGRHLLRSPGSQEHFERRKDHAHQAHPGDGTTSVQGQRGGCCRSHAWSRAMRSRPAGTLSSGSGCVDRVTERW